MSNKPNTIPYLQNLQEAFAQYGCAICRLFTEAADGYIDSLLWEMVNYPDLREELNQARGYCHQHAWMLVRGGAGQGIAILMQDVLKTAQDVLDSASIKNVSESTLKQLLSSIDRRPNADAQKLASRLSPQRPCPICAYLEEIQKHYFDTLLKHMSGSDPLVEAYANSHGLCLPHFKQALGQASGKTNVSVLVKAQQTAWQRLDDDLMEYIRKNDYRFQHEPPGDEHDAWLRALEAVSGAPPRSEHNTGLTQSI
jgi:hypothetical protein